MNDHFRDKCCAAFKSSKAYWNFYKSVVKTKKSASSNQINCINMNGVSIHDKKIISDTFNYHFANLTAGITSECTIDEATLSINDNFLYYKRENLLNVESTFKFAKTTPTEIIDGINKLDSSSSPGFSGIPTKVIKHCATELSVVLSDLFNYCLESCTLPT